MSEWNVIHKYFHTEHSMLTAPDEHMPYIIQLHIMSIRWAYYEQDRQTDRDREKDNYTDEQRHKEKKKKNSNTNRLTTWDTCVKQQQTYHHPCPHCCPHCCCPRASSVKCTSGPQEPHTMRPCPGPLKTPGLHLWNIFTISITAIFVNVSICGIFSPSLFITAIFCQCQQCHYQSLHHHCIHQHCLHHNYF